MDGHPFVHIGVAVYAVASEFSTGVLVVAVAILAALNAQTGLILLDCYYGIVITIDVAAITGA